MPFFGSLIQIRTVPIYLVTFPASRASFQANPQSAMPLGSSVLAELRHQFYDFTGRFLGCREDAADVTQEVLVRFWQRGEQVDPMRRKAWALKVTRNACLDLLRENKTT